MKIFSLQTVSVAVIALSLGACATKPEPPPPMTEAPAPTPTARPAPTPTGPVTSPIQGPAPGTVQDFVVNVGDRVYFDTDSYNLDSEDMQVLDRQVAWLRSYPNVSVLVAGNADERGTREYNLALGERRANSVKNYLVSRGISAARVETVSYGKERPIDGRSTAEAWASNRNSQTQIVGGAVG